MDLVWYNGFRGWLWSVCLKLFGFSFLFCQNVVELIEMGFCSFSKILNKKSAVVYLSVPHNSIYTANQYLNYYLKTFEVHTTKYTMKKLWLNFKRAFHWKHRGIYNDVIQSSGNVIVHTTRVDCFIIHSRAVTIYVRGLNLSNNFKWTISNKYGMVRFCIQSI